MFFMEGTYQRSEFSAGALRFSFNFVVSILALTIVMTWVYNNTTRSILSAILIHFMGNLTGEILNLPIRMEYYRTAWTVVAAVVVILIWGPRQLSSQRTNLSIPPHLG
jgi:membrane protease YdiL (CAAX protease family)